MKGDAEKQKKAALASGGSSSKKVGGGASSALAGKVSSTITVHRSHAPNAIPCTRLIPRHCFKLLVHRTARTVLCDCVPGGTTCEPQLRATPCCVVVRRVKRVNRVECAILSQAVCVREGGMTLLAGASKEQLAKALENSAKKMKSLDKKVAARGLSSVAIALVVAVSLVVVSVAALLSI